MNKTIIVIDDDDYCLYLLSKFLQKKGYEVVCSDSAILCELHMGSQSKCSKKEPCGHFFLTDNRMPGIDGLMLIKRQERGECKVPMEMKALFSGLFTPDELTQAAELGCKIFLKPYDFDELFDWLDSQESARLTRYNDS